MRKVEDVKVEPDGLHVTVVDRREIILPREIAFVGGDRRKGLRPRAEIIAALKEAASGGSA